MSADPVPDAPATPGLAALFDRYAAAWSARDADALLELFAFPHVIASGAASVFFEDAAEARTNLDGLLANYAAHRVASATVARLAMLPLPDDAARVTVLWSLRDAEGAELLRFPALYTLADAGDGWRIVAIESHAEADAWAGAGWA